jgi:deazaflavin-dependent oxidoreductase (nitroreductase family)
MAAKKSRRGGGATVSIETGSIETGSTELELGASGRATSAGPAAPRRAAGNAFRLGPRTRRLIRAVARVVNPVVLRIAGRRHMPIVGIVRHQGRKTGRLYATPLGVRPAVGGGFVVPLTFGDASYWYRNIQVAGWCVITYRGADHTVARPVIVDRAIAASAYPRYERFALRLIGINEFVWLREVPAETPHPRHESHPERRGPAR